MAKKSNSTLYTMPEVSDINRTKAEKAEVVALLREAHSLKQAEERLKAVKKRLVELLQSEAGGVRYGELCCQVAWRPGRKSLDRALLVENGVTPAQIEASMKEGEGYWMCELPQITEEEG